MKKLLRTLGVGVLASWALSTSAQTYFVQEAPTNIRFEQYTGNGSPVVFWRMPTPGTSTFPAGCNNLTIDPTRPEQASRFMALYLFAKTNNKQIFYVYNTSTCAIVSFGMDG